MELRATCCILTALLASCGAPSDDNAGHDGLQACDAPAGSPSPAVWTPPEAAAAQFEARVATFRNAYDGAEQYEITRNLPTNSPYIARSGPFEGDGIELGDDKVQSVGDLLPAFYERWRSFLNPYGATLVQVDGSGRQSPTGTAHCPDGLECFFDSVQYMCGMQVVGANLQIRANRVVRQSDGRAINAELISASSRVVPNVPLPSAAMDEAQIRAFLEGYVFDPDDGCEGPVPYESSCEVEVGSRFGSSPQEEPHVLVQTAGSGNTARLEYRVVHSVTVSCGPSDRMLRVDKEFYLTIDPVDGTVLNVEPHYCCFECE